MRPFGTFLSLLTAGVIAVGLAIGGTDASAQESADPDEWREVIDISPDDKPGFTMRHAMTPVAALFRGTDYYYEKRELEVETTPPGGLVDLFYVRANFQKRFEQAETPVTVLLPPRIETGPRDSLTIRAFREGYRQQSLTLKLTDKREEVTLDLEPLPNTLQIVAQRYFNGRSSLTFLTDELPEFRIQEVSDGFTLVLNETARSKEAEAAMEGVHNPIVEELFGQQLGEDLLVTVSLSESAQESTDLRSRQSRDAARELYSFTVDLVPSDKGAGSVQRALDALAAIRSSDVTGCALDFDAGMREKLDPGDLSRALTPRGDFTDRYLRAAMRRLGEVTPGNTVSFGPGGSYDPTVPIELEAALSQASLAKGYLALLRRFVARLEPEEFRADTLRSLIAPELDSARFAEDLAFAEGRERTCLASR